MQQQDPTPEKPGLPGRRLSLAIRLLLLGGVVATAWGAWYLWPGCEYYMTCREVSPEFRETLKLRNGKFRYWADSDVELSAPPRYPVSGSYRREGNQLILDTSALPSNTRVRIVDTISGVPVLWRNDGW